MEAILAELISFQKRHDSDFSLVLEKLSNIESNLSNLSQVSQLEYKGLIRPASGTVLTKVSNGPLLTRQSIQPSYAAYAAPEVQHILPGQEPLTNLRNSDTAGFGEASALGRSSVAVAGYVETTEWSQRNGRQLNSQGGYSTMGAGPQPYFNTPERHNTTLDAAVEKLRLLGPDLTSADAALSDNGETVKPNQKKGLARACYGCMHNVYEAVWGHLLLPHQKNVWDMFILLLLVWVCFGTPVIICFGLDSQFWNGHPLGYVELLVDIAFVTDMYLNFRTSYIDKYGVLVTGRKQIVIHYLSRWFIPDLISIIPMTYVFGSWAAFFTLFKLFRLIRMAKIFRLLKTYRMLKIIRLPAFIEKLELMIDKSIVNIFFAIFMVILAVHLSACAFFYMAYLGHLSPNTWVGVAGIANAGLWTKYLYSIYWAATTLTTVGYGDITPRSTGERIVTIPLMLLGVNILGFITSSISNIVQIRNANQQAIDTKRHQVRVFLKERGIPKKLATRIRKYFHYVSMREVRADEKDIVEELPVKLRSRVLYHMYKDTIEKVPGFKDQHPDLLAMVVNNLRLEYYMKGDIVSCQGDPPQGMYFIGEGKLEVRTYEIQDQQDAALLLSASTESDLEGWPYKLRGTLEVPSSWGHVSSLESLFCPGTVVASGFCELFVLPTQQLREVLQMFPEAQEMLHPQSVVTRMAPLRRCASLIRKGSVEAEEEQTNAMIEADFPSMIPVEDLETSEAVTPRRGGGLEHISSTLFSRPSTTSLRTGGPNVSERQQDLHPLYGDASNVKEESDGACTLERNSRPTLQRPSVNIYGISHPSLPITLQRNSVRGIASNSMYGGSVLATSGASTPRAEASGVVRSQNMMRNLNLVSDLSSEGVDVNVSREEVPSSAAGMSSGTDRLPISQGLPAPYSTLQRRSTQPFSSTFLRGSAPFSSRDEESAGFSSGGQDLELGFRGGYMSRDSHSQAGVKKYNVGYSQEAQVPPQLQESTTRVLVSYPDTLQGFGSNMTVATSGSLNEPNLYASTHQPPPTDVTSASASATAVFNVVVDASAGAAAKVASSVSGNVDSNIAIVGGGHRGYGSKVFRSRLARGSTTRHLIALSSDDSDADEGRGGALKATGTISMTLSAAATDRRESALPNSSGFVKSQHEGSVSPRINLNIPSGGKKASGRREAVLSLPPLDDNEVEAVSTAGIKAAVSSLDSQGLSGVEGIKGEHSSPSTEYVSAGETTLRRSRRAELLQKPLSSDSDA